MLQLNLAFFNVESIHGFTSTSVTIFYANYHPFGFPYMSKQPPIDTTTCFFAELCHQDNKVTFVQLGKYGALERSSGFMRTCHNNNITVQTIVEGASSRNGKSGSPKKKLDNITRG